MGIYCHLLAGMSEGFHWSQCLPMVSSCLVKADVFVYGAQKRTQSKGGSVVKNKAPLQHPAIQHTQHVFPYTFVATTPDVQKGPFHCGRHAIPSMISIMAIMEDKTICY